MNFDSLTALVAEGDSITAGSSSANTSYVNYIATMAGRPFYSVTKMATGGARISTLSARAATTDSYMPPAGRRGILSVMVGINDWATGMTTGDFLTALASYLDDRRTAGWKVVLCTILPDTEPDIGGVNANIWRNTVNATLVTWAGVHADAICDMGGDPTMGPDSAPNNPAYYLADKVHPTLTGQALLATVLLSTTAGMTI